MDLIREDLAALGVAMDVFYSEKSLYGTGRIEAALADLRGKGLIIRGALKPPKGKTPENWSRVSKPVPSTIRRRRRRPGMKSDGAWTYYRPRHRTHDKISRP